jgi:hypothetical protein
MSFNPSLTDVDGLAALWGISGSLLLEENEALVDLTGLQGVSTVGGDFTIIGNGALTNAEAELLRDAIGMSNIGGLVTISNNAP